MSDTENNEEPKVDIFKTPPEIPEEGAMKFDTAEEAPSEETPEEVDSTEFSEEFSTEDHNLFDHSAEDGAKRTEKEEAGVGSIPLPERIPVPTTNPGVELNAVDAIRDEIESRFSELYKDRKVTVDATERSNFVRSCLHDSELTMDIPIEGLGVSVTVAMPTDSFTSTASSLASLWLNNDLLTFKSDTVWLLAFQQLHAWYQIRAIDGVPTSWTSDVIDDNGKVLPIHVLANKLADPTAIEVMTNMNATRWRMLMEAMYMAEMKYKLCLQNWQDRSFFTGADTD